MSHVALTPTVYDVARDCDTCEATHVAQVDTDAILHDLHAYGALTTPTTPPSLLASIGAGLDRACDGWRLTGTGGRCPACVGGSAS